MFLQDLLHSLHLWLLYHQQCPQTPTSALAAALAPGSTLRADNNPPVSISCRRPPPKLSTPCRPDLRTSALPAFPTLSTTCTTPFPPSLSSGSRPPTSTFLPAFIPLPDPCSPLKAPLSKHCFHCRPTWQSQPLPAVDLLEPLQAPSVPRPHSESSATPGFHPDPLLLTPPGIRTQLP